MAGPCSDSCGVRLWLGAPGHVLVRERSRLRCPNVDHIRRRFRSSSPGCWYSGAICGAGGQRVFLPSVPPALRPSSAWCSVEQNQPHPMAGPCFAPCGARLWFGVPGHILARERSRLQCPNVDRIRRRFRSSSPGCRCSRAIRGAGGQRVFLPSVPSALRPSFAWCSVEQNQPYPMAGPCFAPCRARLWLGAPGHVLVRERSRLRCPNVDRIRRRFRSSSLGCRCSGTICGVGGQRVFLPFAPPALRPSSWCSVEQNQPHLWQGLVPIHAEPAYGLEHPTIYLQGKIPVTMPKC